MRALLLALALACAAAGAYSQQPQAKKKPAPSRQVDDSRARQALEEAQDALHRGDFPAAEAASLRLLQENIRAFGPDHPNVAVALNLLGAANLRQGKFNEAEGHFRRMLTINQRRLGPQHEDTAAALKVAVMAEYVKAKTAAR